MTANSATLERPRSAPSPSAIGRGPVVRPRFRGLDGLRAIAVSAVLVYHLSPGALPGGYIGVDVFFVISGFLITALLLRERDLTGRVSLTGFWRRRARRLLPALAVVVLVCTSAAFLVGGDVLVDLRRQLLGAVTFSSNWLDIAGDHSYFDQVSPELFRNLWSLAVEEQFYLVWPLVVLVLMLFASPRWPLVTMIVIAAASAVSMAVLFVPGADATRVYYGTDTHSFGLAIGALLAIVSHRWSPTAIGWSRVARFFAPLIAIPGLVAIAVALFVLPTDSAFTYRGGLVVVAIATALAISGSIVPGSLIGRMLDAAPLRFVGERSYGLYLWHWPVFVLVVVALPTWPRTGGSGWLLGGIALVITSVLAVLSYRFVELPIRTRGFRASASAFGAAFRAGPWRAVAASVSVLIVIATGVGTAAALDASPEVSDAQVRIERGRAAVSDAAPTPPSTPAAPAPSPSPVPAALPGGDQITAIGDSVMLASAPELQAAFPGIQIDAVVSRQLRDAPQLLADLAAQGALRPTVLIGLGTNGPIDEETLVRLREIAGRGHQIVVVNVQAPRGWTDGVNVVLTDFAQRYRDVELANWRDAISGQLSLLASDQIHPGSRGGQVYASAVRDALQRLAELPPLLRPNDYGLAPRPE